MMRIFLDSSVLFSAAYSAKGHSRDLIILAMRESIIPVISEIVIHETRRNLAHFNPETLSLLEIIEINVPFEMISITREEILDASRYVVQKDAPIVAAARKGKVDLLVTLDKKHLLGNSLLVEYIGAPVVPPKEALDIVQSQGKI